MTKGTRGRRGIASRQCRHLPYPLPGQSEGIKLNCSKINSKDWKDAKCSVCMECPHNAVLLLCSSHDKGCHPYMCGTSFRYSNCLNQYKKAYSKVTSSDNCPLDESFDNPAIGGAPSSGPVKNHDILELACPLCRGQVKGWTVVVTAREYFNAKKRNCMQDNCSFIGTFKELRRHMREDHPSAKPREVDPTLEKKWKRMERERERDDVISTIRSSMPGAVFFGDYVIEGNQYGSDSDEEGFDADTLEQNEGFEVGVDRNFMSLFLFLQAFGSAGNTRLNRGARQQESDSSHMSDRGGNASSHEHTAPHLHRQNGTLLGRSGRRRRRESDRNL